MTPMKWALASLALALAGSARAAEPRVVEEVVAVVRGPGSAQPRLITLTRLEEEARIALVWRGALGAASAPLDRVALRAALEWVVDQTLLGDEVTRLQVFDIDAREVEEELRRFRDRFPRLEDYRAFLGQLELGEEELAAVLRRMLRVQRYVESRAGAAEPAAVEGKVRALVADVRGRAEVRVLSDLAGEAR
jgi:hypothetical protein